MKRKIIGLLVMIFGIMLGGFLAAISISVVIVRWRAPEYTGYESNLTLAIAAAVGAVLCFLLCKLGVRIADKLPSE